MSDMLERVRMCVAEAGYDPLLVIDTPEFEVGWSYSRFLPHDIAWRAWIVTTPPPEDLCLSCYIDIVQLDPEERSGSSCLADRPLVEDCGTRS